MKSFFRPAERLSSRLGFRAKLVGTFFLFAVPLAFKV